MLSRFLTLCTNFQVFAHFALQSSLMKLYFWYLLCKHFPEDTHQYILFAPLFLHLKHFEASALLCVVKYILLDFGRNLWHSLVLQPQISNFPYSLKNSVSCVKLFSLKHSTLSLNEATKAHCFCFLLLIQLSAVQQKSNKVIFPNTKYFFNCKARVVRTVAVFIVSQYFLVFNISDNCSKSSHILWTLSDYNCQSPEGFGFQACYSASTQSPTARFWKLKNVLGKLQESVLYEMKDKSLRVKLSIVSLPEHNLNQQISLFNFRSFNSTRKVKVEESFVSYTFKPNTSLPNITVGSLALLSL